MSQIELQQAQEQLAELVERAVDGEEIVIAKDEQPLVQLVAVAARKKRHFGSAKGQVEMADDFDEPLEDFREYM